MDPLRIVGIGGGTGLPVLLRGLAGACGVEISAVVAVSDNGGSSGRLREILGMPAVGDLRNCLVALSNTDSPFAELMQHRFSGGGLEGHALGNLILAALHQKTGSLAQAAEVTREMLVSKGRALVATDTPVTLCARFADGTSVRGETEIARTSNRIQDIWLEPRNPLPGRGVLEAIFAADAVVLAPGSLYTSLLPNLLVAGVADAIRQSRAAKILICNLMTQPGETEGFTASDHVRVVESVLGRHVVEFCVVNSGSLVPVPRYSERGLEMVYADSDRIRQMGATPIEAAVVAVAGERIRHNSARLAQIVCSIGRVRKRLTQFDPGKDNVGVSHSCLNPYSAASGG
jgi:uncharacterized cofD-like protein